MTIAAIGWVSLTGGKLVYAPSVVSLHPGKWHGTGSLAYYEQPHLVNRRGESMWISEIDYAILKEATKL